MQTEAEKQLAKLVSIPTTSDDVAANDKALDYIEAYLAERGMYCGRERFDGHGTLVASTRPDNAKTPTVLLAGHVDVMAASDKMFKLRQKSDKLFGRGVYDMKFALAGYMQLVDELRDSLSDYDFAIMVTTDEEYGGRDGINGTRRLVERGYLPQVCIIPDSTAPGWEIEQRAKGPWRFDLIATGKSAHGSRPWEGDSAAFKLLDALYELKGEFHAQGPATESLNIGVIEGGVTFNQIPERMRAAVEIRIINNANFAMWQQRIKELCKRHNLIFKERVYGLPTEHDLSQPLVRVYMDSVESITGKRPKGYTSCGQSDVKVFAAQGIPGIVSCPEGGGHHSEDEWISRKSFAQFVPILRHYLDKTAKLPATAVDNAAALV